MSEVRYWERAGFPVTRSQAEEMIERISEGAIGAVRDDDIEEFVPVGGGATHDSLRREVEELFSQPASEKDQQIDESIANIMALMSFEQNKKQYIMDCKARGLTLEEAREEYDTDKANMVRNALDLPDQPMDVPVIYGKDSEE
jgi:hypothetical protein